MAEVLLLYKLRCYTRTSIPEKSRNNTREKIRYFLTRVWYRQSAADTSFAFRATRSGCRMNERQSVRHSQSVVACARLSRSTDLSWNKIFEIFNTYWADNKILIGWVCLSPTGRKLAIDHGAWTSPRANKIFRPPSHSVNKYIFFL